MSVTVAQICNLALSHIKQTQSLISNLDTDTGNTADILRIHYDICRQYVLSDHNWNFAGKRQALALLQDSGIVGWNYKYEYPSDCLQFRSIELTNRTNSPIAYVVESDTSSTKCIFTDEQSAVGVYTFDAEDPSIFSSGFVNSLSWYLASQIAPALSESDAREEACLTVYLNTLKTSKTMDSNEGEADAQAAAEWDVARTGGSE